MGASKYGVIIGADIHYPMIDQSPGSGGTKPPGPLIFEVPMPSSKVLHEFKEGRLHIGSKHGPLVRDRKQAVAIMLSERRDEQAEEQARKRTKPTRTSR